MIRVIGLVLALVVLYGILVFVAQILQALVEARFRWGELFSIHAKLSRR